jgi:hypothetical protein
LKKEGKRIKIVTKPNLRIKAGTKQLRIRTYKKAVQSLRK